MAEVTRGEGPFAAASRFARDPWRAPALAALLLAGALAAHHAAAWRRAAAARAELEAAVARGELVLHVPHAPGAITLDGDTDDPGWLHPPGPARIATFFREDGRPARPTSQARLVWSGDYLYLALYAADEDIECRATEPDAELGEDDAFRVVFSRPGEEYAFEVTPRGVLGDAIRRGDGAWDYAWSSGAHASVEMDGSMNDPRNMDEEWAIELAVPLASLHLRGERGESIGLRLRRCDTPKRSPRVCASWGEPAGARGGGRIVLD